MVLNVRRSHCCLKLEGKQYNIMKHVIWNIKRIFQFQTRKHILRTFTICQNRRNNVLAFLTNVDIDISFLQAASLPSYIPFMFRRYPRKMSAAVNGFTKTYAIRRIFSPPIFATTFTTTSFDIISRIVYIFLETRYWFYNLQQKLFWCYETLRLSWHLIIRIYKRLKPL